MPREKTVFADSEWEGIATRIPLSPRQLEISQCLFRGLGDKQIARKLNISISTLRTHLSRLFEKTKTMDRVAYILHVTQDFMAECRELGCPHRK